MDEPGTKLSDVSDAVFEALSHPPDLDGGTAIAMATAASPPAMAVLSTGDVVFDGRTVLVGIHGSSSVVSRLNGAFTLLVPLRSSAARIEVVDAIVELAPPLAKISGTVDSIRPTAEPPWTLRMLFLPEPADHPALPAFVRYWADVRSWLRGDRPEPPAIPHS